MRKSEKISKRVWKGRGKERSETNHRSSRLELEGLLRLVVDEIVQVGSESESLLGSDWSDEGRKRSQLLARREKRSRGNEP